MGGAAPAGPGDPPVLIVILALLVVGEELGWRGFALPRLQARFGGLGASLILGALWAAWHLANTAIPGLERYWYAFPAFALFVVAQTILFTWIANHTRGSVLLAWLFHAAINVAGSQFAIGDPVRQWWLSARCVRRRRADRAGRRGAEPCASIRGSRRGRCGGLISRVRPPPSKTSQIPGSAWRRKLSDLQRLLEPSLRLVGRKTRSLRREVTRRS